MRTSTVIRSNLKFWLVSLGMALTVSAGTPLAAQECPSLQSASPNEHASYLEKTPDSRRNSPCIAFALKKIGEHRYEPAIPVLTKFLQFRWPPGVNQKQRRFVLEHDGFTIYPAAEALERIGKVSLPAVLDAMKTTAPTHEAMEVAVSVWMTIYKDQAPAGVALLKQEADKTTKALPQQRLGWAAFRAATGWCNSSERPQCEAILESHFSEGPPSQAVGVQRGGNTSH
jgi:hypothetical protein